MAQPARAALSYPIDCATRERIGPRAVPDFRLSFTAQGSRYTIRWRTEKAWSGQCRDFELTLRDGTVHLAPFDFRR